MTAVKIVPTLGRIVLYVLSASDVAEIRRLRDAVPLGNPVEPGQAYPAQVVRVFSENCINLQVFLDGRDSFWATSRHVSEEPTPGCFHWMPYQREQAAKQDPAVGGTSGQGAKVEAMIVASGATAPRVTPEQIAALIGRVTFVPEHRPGGSTSTFVHAFLDGKFFLTTGHSACVDPANYREAIGLEIATNNARATATQKLWELEGYRLYRQLND